jgi:hypothetical protein
MALPTLAQFIMDLTPPNPTGQVNRIAFNETAFKQVGGGTANPTLSGEDLKAFLSFQKGQMCMRALQVLTNSKPNLDDPVANQEFWMWFWDFTRWNWPGGEEDKYVGVKPSGLAAQGAQYGGPSCQIHKVKAAGTGTWTIDVYVEGALPGNTLEIRAFGTGALVDSGKKALEPSSTFRYGLITFSTNTLTAGQKYVVTVVNDLGGGLTFPITGITGEFIAT